MKNLSKSTELMVWPLAAVLIFLAFQLIGSTVVSTVVFFSYGQEEVDTADVASWALAASSLLTIVSMIGIRYFGLRLPLAFTGNKGSIVAASLLGFVCALVVATIFNELMDEALGVTLPEEYQRLFEGTVRNPVGLVAMCLLGPVCEECVFRGGIMRPMLAGGLKPAIPIVVSSVVFALVHGNMVQMVYALIMGLVLAVIYYRTGSLLVTSLCHVLNNTSTAVMMLTMPEDYDHITVGQLVGRPLEIVLLVVSALLAFFLLRWLWRHTDVSFAQHDFEETE